ncbi:MAG: hypothetical protein JXB10_06630 [Pirellulales bacterium]|nr:hypothetical protein [Pirellulales bacterium]
MALDAYSYCPGGTGKKIKFCCGDFLPELQKIDRMLEGEQYQACLQHVERLREQPSHRDRQCLLAYQAELLRLTGQAEAAARLVAEYLEKFPQNQAALAEASLQESTAGDTAAAMVRLQQALAAAQAAEGVLSWQVTDAAEDLAQAMLAQGRVLPARALSAFLLSVNKQNETAGQTYLDCLRSEAVPLLFKEDPRIDAPPSDAPWKDRFQAALEPLRYGVWQTAADKLTAVAEQFPKVPAIWQMLARLRGWLDDRPGCVFALRKFAALPVPRDDAVEAEARALLLSPPPLGDPEDVLHVTWTVRDAERVHEALLSDNRFRNVPFDPAVFAHEDAPPPKTLLMVLDRPPLTTAAGASWESLPRYLGDLALFGKQTDREARLELMGIARHDYIEVKTLLESLAAEALAPDPGEEIMQIISRSITQLHLRWDPPEDLTAAQERQWSDLYLRDYLLERWPEAPLGCLDGLSPRAAAADPAWTNRLLAAVLVLEHFLGRLGSRFDGNELRRRLGLPESEPIDPTKKPLDAVPVSRWDRVQAEKFSEADLTQAFLRAQRYHAVEAIRKFSEEILRRPSFEKKAERIGAYAALARLTPDPDQAQAYLDEGKKAAATAGLPDGLLDLQELYLRITRRQGTEILKVIEHVHTRHEKEPEILDAMTHTLMQTGILLPDGRMAIPMTRQEMEQMAAASGGPAGASPPEPGGLWTPGSAAPAAAGKLWTPD